MPDSATKFVFKSILFCLGLILSFQLTASGSGAGDERMNVIFILTDDQRYDELGFMNPVLETPNMDRLAAEGVHFRNAFVTTSLCSPSRASILTGQYMHNHGVVDNNSGVAEGTIFFPKYLQKAGYQTAFFGKWHMGETESSSANSDDPQPGFDHWLSFAGQGHYYPVVSNGKVNQININGEHVPQKGYITDELTDYTLDWLTRAAIRKSRSSFTCRTRRCMPISHRRTLRSVVRGCRDTRSGEPGGHQGELPRQAHVGKEPTQQLARG